MLATLSALGQRARRGGRSWSLYVAAVGPGIIAATAGNDVGGIATYASVGAKYGYELIWMMLLTGLAVVIVQEQCARLGVVTGKGLSDLIREQFGPRWTVIAMLGFLIANGGVTVTEFVGIGAAAELFGIPRLFAVPLMAGLVWYLIVYGNYRRVERLFLALALVSLAYPISAIWGNPDWSEVMRHAVMPTARFDPDFILLFVATVGTTISPYMQMYQQDAVVEKGMTDDDLTYARADVIVGCMFAIFVAICIIIATASTIYTASDGQGVVIETAEQAALALVPLVGPYASYLFAAGIFGASMLAAGVLPLATARSVCEAFGFERGVELELQEAPIFYGILTILIVGGTVIALLPGIPVVRVLIVAQAINCVVLPILLVFITRMSADTRLIGRYANGRVHSAAAWVVTVVIGFLALTVLGSTLYQAVVE
jgi:Mn2+/Fe2+ NRAMP family transporter